MTQKAKPGAKSAHVTWFQSFSQVNKCAARCKSVRICSQKLIKPFEITLQVPVCNLAYRR